MKDKTSTTPIGYCFTEKQRRTVQERVKRGAKLLDVARPRWIDHVPNSIVMSSSSRCIVGNVFKVEVERMASADPMHGNPYGYGLLVLGGQVGYEGDDFAGDHGFNTMDRIGGPELCDVAQYDLLAMLWKKEIAKRRTAEVA